MQAVNAVLSFEFINRTQASCHRHVAKANDFNKKKACGTFFNLYTNKK
jgi:hypothetical protein